MVSGADELGRALVTFSLEQTKRTRKVGVTGKYGTVSALSIWVGERGVNVLHSAMVPPCASR